MENDENNSNDLFKVRKRNSKKGLYKPIFKRKRAINAAKAKSELFAARNEHDALSIEIEVLNIEKEKISSELNDLNNKIKTKSEEQNYN